MKASAVLLELERDVPIRVGGKVVEGELALPPNPHGLVLFAHGGGSTRFSPRTRAVAHALRDIGLATLLLDLLSESESDDRENVYDIPLLSHRLRSVAEWTRQDADLGHLPVGLFGVGTGVAAALVAAACPPPEVAAIVGRGGRPDLAGDYVREVEAPTLLIVGEADEGVLELNQRALFELTGTRRLAVVPGATNLFEEFGAIAEVARLTTDWFQEHLVSLD